MKRTPLNRRTPLRAKKSLRSGPPKGIREQLPSQPYSARAARLRSKISQPNARQLRWREAVRRLGSILTGEFPVEIHHCAGRTARHDGVAIGHDWILPLTREQHQGEEGIHRATERKRVEKELFERVLARLDDSPDVPPPHVIAAIRRYRR